MRTTLRQDGVKTPSRPFASPPSKRSKPSGTAAAWIVSLGPWAQEPPRLAAFVAQSLQAGDVRVLPIPLAPGDQVMDLAVDGRGWLLLSAQPIKPGQWRSQIVRLSPRGGGLSQHTLVSFTAPMPAR